VSASHLQLFSIHYISCGNMEVSKFGFHVPNFDMVVALATSLDASFGVSISVFRLFIPSLGKSEAVESFHLQA
ncbi:hypothetical protein ACJX0J_027845, partial [Zea mays]